MRPKALLHGAAIGAASLVTSMAQVYSVNIVGYVNTPIPNGWSIICNPLNASGGNTIANVMPNPPVGVNVFKFVNSSGAYQVSAYDAEFLEWSYPGLVVDPGIGLFVQNGGTNFTWTFVGEVPTGTQTIQIGHGFNLVSSVIPKTGKLQTDLGYDPSHGVGLSDNVYKYINATGGYQTYSYDGEFEEWSVEPTIEVGVGFWLLRGGPAIPWTQTFNVGS